MQLQQAVDTKQNTYTATCTVSMSFFTYLFMYYFNEPGNSKL